MVEVRKTSTAEERLAALRLRQDELRAARFAKALEPIQIYCKVEGCGQFLGTLYVEPRVNSEGPVRKTAEWAAIRVFSCLGHTAQRGVRRDALRNSWSGASGRAPG